VLFAERLVADERMRARTFTDADLARVDAVVGALGLAPLRLAGARAESA